MSCVINTLEWFIDANITYKSGNSQISQFISWYGIHFPYQKWSSDIRDKNSGRQTLMKKGVNMLLRYTCLGLLDCFGVLCLCGSKTGGISINSTGCLNILLLCLKQEKTVLYQPATACIWKKEDIIYCYCVIFNAIYSPFHCVITRKCVTNMKSFILNSHRWT